MEKEKESKAVVLPPNKRSETSELRDAQQISVQFLQLVEERLSLKISHLHNALHVEFPLVRFIAPFSAALYLGCLGDKFFSKDSLWSRSQNFASHQGKCISSLQ